MPDQPPISISSQPSTPSPDEVANRTFPTVRRGLDADAVRRYLGELSAHLRELQARESALHTRLAEAERRAAAPELDEATLSHALGNETARVLTAVHEAAREIVANAEARAEALVSDAEHSIADRSRAAEEQAEMTLVTARAAAHALHEEAAAECRAMVIEAREARRHILADLAERRRSLHRQLEQLRAGKDALSGVVVAVASSVDAVRTRLERAEDEARLAADDAGREQFAAGDDRPIEEVVAEALAAALPSLSRTAAPGGETAGSDGPTEHDDLAPAGGVATLTEEPAADPPHDDVVVGDQRIAEGTGGDASEHDALDDLFARLRADADSIDAAINEAMELVPSSAPENQLDEVVLFEDESSPDDADMEPEAPEGEGALAVGATAVLEATDLESIAPTITEAPERALGTSPEPSHEHVAQPGGEEGGDAALLAARDRLLELPSAELSRALKRIMRVEQNELLDACRHLTPSGSVAALFALPGAAERIAQAAVASINAALEAGTEFISSDELPRAATARRAEELAESVAADLVAGVERRLSESLEELASEDLDPIAVANAVFREWRGERLESLAGDAATSAFALGSLAAASAAGVTLRWVVDDGGAPCPDCDDNALADAQPAGSAFPTGHEHGPIHPGCRCVLVGGT